MIIFELKMLLYVIIYVILHSGQISLERFRVLFLWESRRVSRKRKCCHGDGSVKLPQIVSVQLMCISSDLV